MQVKLIMYIRIDKVLSAISIDTMNRYGIIIRRIRTVI